MRRLLSSLLLLSATAVGAAQPSFDDIARRLYVLRAVPSAGQRDTGVFEYDSASSSFTRKFDLPYAPGSCCYPTTNLTALDDRLVVQGADFYEFDLATGRLLRRYPALDAAYPNWAFSGVAVSEAAAARLGIPSGYFGFPQCPPGDFGGRCSVPTMPFPGYLETPGRIPPTNFDVILRRPLGATHHTLELAARLQTEGVAAFTRRFLSLDLTRRGLWSWTEFLPDAATLERVQQLGFIGTADGQLSGESIRAAWHSTSATNQTYTESFAYAPHDDAVYLSEVDIGTNRFSLLKKSVSTLADEVVDGAVPGKQNDAITNVPAMLPTDYVQVVPAVGEGPGAQGTYWHSDVYLFNPSDQAMSVAVRRVARPSKRIEFVLDPHSSKKIAGALHVVGGGPVADGGDGVVTDALVVESPYVWGRQLAVYSRTFTASTSGTYGQAVPAVPDIVGYSTHSRTFEFPLDFETRGSTIVLDKRDPSRFRHNLGVVNDGDADIVVRLRFDGLPTGELSPDSPYDRSFSVAAHSVANVNLETLFPVGVFEKRPPRLWLAATQSAPVWLSIVDNVTGDATFVPFSLFALQGSDRSLVAIPAVAKTRGANATTWQTDVYGLFLPIDAGENLQEPLVTLYPADGTSCSAGSSRLHGVTGVQDTWPRYYESIFPDVLGQMGCQADVRGAVEVRSASWMTGFSRTYTTRPDGGTLGEMLPFYPAGGWPEQHFAGIDVRDGFRINIGLYNGMTVPVANRLELRNAEGTLVGTATVTLASRESTQVEITRLFGTIASGTYGLSVVPEGDGRSWAYVSTIDNVSGDPTNWW